MYTRSYSLTTEMLQRKWKPSHKQESILLYNDAESESTFVIEDGKKEFGEALNLSSIRTQHS